jgi:hypothetical protein
MRVIAMGVVAVAVMAAVSVAGASGRDEKACGAGDDRACVRAAKAVRGKGKVERRRKLLETACARKYAPACKLIAEDRGKCRDECRRRGESEDCMGVDGGLMPCPCDCP